MSLVALTYKKVCRSDENGFSQNYCRVLLHEAFSQMSHLLLGSEPFPAIGFYCPPRRITLLQCSRGGWWSRGWTEW